MNATGDTVIIGEKNGREAVGDAIVMLRGGGGDEGWSNWWVSREYGRKKLMDGLWRGEHCVSFAVLSNGEGRVSVCSSGFPLWEEDGDDHDEDDAPHYWSERYVRQRRGADAAAVARALRAKLQRATTWDDAMDLAAAVLDGAWRCWKPV